MMNPSEYEREDTRAREADWAALGEEMRRTTDNMSTKRFQEIVSRWAHTMAGIYELGDVDADTLGQAAVSAAMEAFEGPLDKNETIELLLGRALVFMTAWAEEHGVQLFEAGVHFLKYTLAQPMPRPIEEEAFDGSGATDHQAD